MSYPNLNELHVDKEQAYSNPNELHVDKEQVYNNLIREVNERFNNSLVYINKLDGSDKEKFQAAVYELCAAIRGLMRVHAYYNCGSLNQPIDEVAKIIATLALQGDKLAIELYAFNRALHFLAAAGGDSIKMLKKIKGALWELFVSCKKSY